MDDFHDLNSSFWNFPVGRTQIFNDNGTNSTLYIQGEADWNSIITTGDYHLHDGDMVEFDIFIDGPVPDGSTENAVYFFLETDRRDRWGIAFKYGHLSAYHRIYAQDYLYEDLTTDPKPFTWYHVRLKLNSENGLFETEVYERDNPSERYYFATTMPAGKDWQILGATYMNEMLVDNYRESEHQIVEAYDYYPFGLNMPGRTISSGSNTLEKFTGKQRDTETGLDYFGARYYVPALGKWTSVDPLADKYPDVSPYNYCGNEPINRIDPFGLIDIYLWFQNSTLTKTQQNQVIEQVKETLEKAGLKDVHVKRPGWIHRNIIGKGCGDKIDITYSPMGDPYFKGIGGYAKKGAGIGVIREGVYTDDPSTEINEKVIGIANTTSHEIGHASKAKLGDSDDNSVMKKEQDQNDAQKKLEFNKKDSAELRKYYNKSEGTTNSWAISVGRQLLGLGPSVQEKIKKITGK